MAFETDFAMEFENFRKKFIELEQKSKRDEMMYSKLENEVETLKKTNQELQEKITTIQKLIVDSMYVQNVRENLHKVMIENKDETEPCLGKQKVKASELNIQADVSGSPNKKMGPSTPGVAKSPVHGVFYISEQDVNHNNEEHMDNLNFHLSNTRSIKRKRAAKVITSDDESSYDDNAPISTLKKQRVSSVSTNSGEEDEEFGSSKHLKRLRKSEPLNKQDNISIDLNKTVSSSDDEEDDDGGVDVSDSEDESLDGFIVHSSENDSDSETGDGKDESEDALAEFKSTLDKIGRKKVSNLKWDLEGDMLSDFAKDPELCMRAVCALYRQQTCDEKACKVTIYHNARGFSQPDSFRASELAEFLIDGDVNGDLSRTVDELNEDDIKRCKALAAKYSKQLFTIYQNNEDPYFPPKC